MLAFAAAVEASKAASKAREKINKNSDKAQRNSSSNEYIAQKFEGLTTLLLNTVKNLNASSPDGFIGIITEINSKLEKFGNNLTKSYNPIVVGKIMIMIQAATTFKNAVSKRVDGLDPKHKECALAIITSLENTIRMMQKNAISPSRINEMSSNQCHCERCGLQIR